MYKKLLSFALVLVTLVAMISCDSKKGEGADGSKERPLLLSSQELDGVFNPFYSSSAADSQIVGMTQIGMLGNNSKGEPTYGEDEAVVVLDYETVYDKKADTTTYYFVLKNNVKFSNGSSLTIRDVLFNLYVYLDPVYTGSSTIYSTDIVGLKEYRTQEEDENSQDSFMEQFQIEAETRMDNLVNYANDIIDDNEYVSFSIEEFREKLEEYSDNDENVLADYDKVCELFAEELDTDYKNSGGEAYKDVVFKDSTGTPTNVKLNSDVEMFLYNEGYLRWNRDDAKLECSFTSNIDEIQYWTKEDTIKKIYEDKLPLALEEVVYYWNTSSKLYEFLVNEAMEEFHKNNERVFNNISGIKFANMKEDVIVRGKLYPACNPSGDKSYDGSNLTNTNEVLSITINGVDPKAIWNCAFSVAPMYYYSDKEHIEAFDYEKNFGVEYASQEFMETVIKNSDKIGVPVGAGPYQVCDSSHSTENVKAADFRNNNILYYTRNDYYIGGKPEIKYLHYQVVPTSNLINSLYSKEVDFIQPNSNPETIKDLDNHKKDGIGFKSITTSGYGYIGVNASFVPDIKVRQAIMHSIDTSMTVTYYGTEAKAIYRSMSLTSWAYPDGCTPYYPYIGGPVPTDLDVVNPDYADYVEECGKKAGDFFTEQEQTEFIIRLVEGSDYQVGGDGVYTNGKTKLKYTFTIAGSDKDHPAFNAFLKASEFLNEINFDITVSTDAQALSKLASGNLAVWAAAWSSTIDPDMYQVYHKDSTATSTLNWGYKQILQNTGGKYDVELAIVEELSEIIEKARETEDQNKRKRYYETALNLVMELAVELPTYQRDDLFAYNNKVIDEKSLNTDLSPYTGLLSDIHKVRLLKTK